MPDMSHRRHIRTAVFPVLLLRDHGASAPELPTALAGHLQQDDVRTLQLPVQTGAQTKAFPSSTFIYLSKVS